MSHHYLAYNPFRGAYQRFDTAREVLDFQADESYGSTALLVSHDGKKFMLTSVELDRLANAGR